jgi:hypothetical protein
MKEVIGEKEQTTIHIYFISGTLRQFLKNVLKSVL